MVPVKRNSLIYLLCCNAISSDYFSRIFHCLAGHVHLKINRCTLRVEPLDGACQLRLDLLDFALAQPSGDGVCNTDVISLSGTESDVPMLCGENSGQHIIADFSDDNPIVITIKATAGYTFGRHWNVRVTQIACDSGNKGKINVISRTHKYRLYFVNHTQFNGRIKFHSNSSTVRLFAVLYSVKRSRT